MGEGSELGFWLDTPPRTDKRHVHELPAAASKLPRGQGGMGQLEINKRESWNWCCHAENLYLAKLHPAKHHLEK